MKSRPGRSVSCLLLFLSLLVLALSQSVPDQEQQEMNKKSPSKWKFPLSSPPSITLAAYWATIKNKYLELATSPLSFLSPHKPNTDFRVKSEEEEEERGTGKKVKGAVGKSMEKTKETIEESAKSAADRIKKTISQQTPLATPQDEL